MKNTGADNFRASDVLGDWEVEIAGAIHILQLLRHDIEKVEATHGPLTEERIEFLREQLKRSGLDQWMRGSEIGFKKLMDIFAGRGL